MYIGSCLIDADSAIDIGYIKQGTTLIADYALSGAKKMTSVVFPESVRYIGRYAMNDCIHLTEIKIADSVESIGENVLLNTAYSDDPENKVDGVLYMGNYAIKTLVSSVINLRQGTIGVADNAFGSFQVEELHLPDSLRFIGNNAFYNVIVV